MTQLMETTTAPTAPELSVVQGWRTYLTDIARRLGPYFARAETRQRVMTYLQGRLSPAERKNSWQLAEETGDVTPDGFQYLLARADWAADAVRDELRMYIRQHLSYPNGVIVIDETGFLKEGQHSAGVARQYSGTAGKVEDCQIGVCVTYASRLGHALLDRELYLPEEWTTEDGSPKGSQYGPKGATRRGLMQTRGPRCPCPLNPSPTRSVCPGTTLLKSSIATMTMVPTTSA
jgi:hypothetical protein